MAPTVSPAEQAVLEPQAFAYNMPAEVLQAEDAPVGGQVFQLGGFLAPPLCDDQVKARKRINSLQRALPKAASHHGKLALAVAERAKNFPATDRELKNLKKKKLRARDRLAYIRRELGLEPLN